MANPWLEKVLDDLLYKELMKSVKLRTHSPDQCAGNFCCIHNPSDHHMRTWPQVWREDRHIMERTCKHGVGHPDPDCIYAQKDSVHGCDGCCTRKD